jgi:hypothetical protein
LIAAWGRLSDLADLAREQAAKTRSHNAPAWRVAWRALAIAAGRPGLRAIATLEALRPLRRDRLTLLPSVPSTSDLAAALSSERWDAVAPLLDPSSPRQRRYLAALAGCAVWRHPYYGVELIVDEAGDVIIYSRARERRYAEINGAPLFPLRPSASPDHLAGEIMVATLRLAGASAGQIFGEEAAP